MTTLAVIPARGGSKGIPRKNLQLVGGVPLVVRAIRSAQESQAFDAVSVSTDDDEVAELSAQADASVVWRPAELAQDCCTSESALTHALDVIEAELGAVDIVAMIQPTSPFISPADLAEAVHRVRSGEADSLFSAYPTHAFLWRLVQDGAVGVNHDHTVRLRRQDIEPQFQETGAFYIMGTQSYRSTQHRFTGRVGVQTVDAEWAVDIDAPHDLDRARQLASRFDETRVGETFNRVRALVTDFDGVHTDDKALVDEAGHESVRVSRSDGLGMQMLREAGLPILILSKERNPVVSARAAKLGAEVLQAVDDKATALGQWAAQQAIPLDQIAYVGNDVNDIEAMRVVGFPVAVGDAHPQVRVCARLVLSHDGGDGALRELAEIMINARDEGEGV